MPKFPSLTVAMRRTISPQNACIYWPFNSCTILQRFAASCEQPLRYTVRMSRSHESTQSRFALCSQQFCARKQTSLGHEVGYSTIFRKIAAVLLVLAAFGQSHLAAAQAPTFMRYPNTFGDKIVFEARDSLWLASLQGGTATQLTHGLSHDLLPRFSPDGKWIAFTRINQRSEDVYVLPSEGGTPRRLTFRSSRAGGPGPTFSQDDNLVVTWSPDSSSIIFLARRQAFNWSDLSLYSVPVTGGLPTLLPLHPSGWMTYGPDRHTVAFTRSFTSFQSRKHYEGGLAPDIFTYDFATKSLTQITHWKGTDDLPMWAGRKIYFLSDGGAQRRANIWVYDLQTKATRQVTHFTDYDVDMPSLGKGSISFQQGGSMYALSLADEGLHKLQVSVPDDGQQTMARIIKTGSMFTDADQGGTNYTLSPNGEFAIVSSRGDLYRLSPGGSTSVNLTHTSNAAETHPAISPNGSLVAYLTDYANEQQVALLPVDGGREQLLSQLHGGFLHTPIWSPDGKALLVANSSNQLWWLPVDGSTPHLIAQDPKNPILDASFSPDSRWIAYSKEGATEQHSLHLYSLAAGKDHALASSQSSDHHPVFSADGDALIFLSDRDSLVVRSSAETNFATLKTSGLFVAPLYRNEAFPGPNSPDIEQTYDLEHVMERVTPLGTGPSDVSWLAVSHNTLYYTTSSATTTGESLPGDTPAMHRYSFASKKDEVVAENVDAATLGSANGSENESLLYEQQGHWQVARNATAKIEALPIDSMDATINPREEWGEIFRQAARYEKDLFFDPGMDGVDWDRTTRHYAELLPLVGSRDDLSYLLMQMLGELASSHIFLYGGEDLSPPVPKASLLGADYALDSASGRYWFSRIYAGDNSRLQYRSPLTTPGQSAQAGQFLLAINGKELIAPTTPDELLVGTSGAVSLSVASTPTGPRRNISVTPLRGEFAVRESAWVEHNRAVASELSNGRVGYVYLSDFSDGGTEEFLRQFYSQTDKQALVVDVRWNGGGDTSQWVLERLRRTLQGGFLNRNGGVQTLPDGLLSGPKVCITNAATASDGDQFAYYFKQNRLGPVVGERTWGGVRGVGGGFILLDGAFLTVPHDVLFNAKGDWIIENQGVSPDRNVLEMPEDNSLHRDRFLHDAVTILSQTLRSKPLHHPSHSPLPAYPHLRTPAAPYPWMNFRP